MKKYQPYEYQKRGTEFILKHKYCAIMLDSGMGKKVIALTAILILKYDYFDGDKVLIITQKHAARGSWINELNKWEHLKELRWSLIMGSDREKIAALHVDADVYITNVENIQWLINLGFWNFGTIVIDGLSNFKNEKSKRFRALQAVRSRTNRIVGLTATPAANGMQDLWAEFFLLDEGIRLGKNKYGFYERYFFTNRIWCGGTFRYYRELKNGAKEAICNAIADICMTAEKSDMEVLPVTRYEYMYADMDVQEYSKYQWLEKEMFLHMEDSGELNANSSVELSTKLLQMANGAVYDDEKRVLIIHQRKMEVLYELVERCNGKNVLIVYYFQHDRDIISKHFPEAKVICTDKDVNDWNNNKIHIGLMNPAAIGDNVDMYKGGNIIIWYSLTWSLKLYERMNNRLINYVEKNNVIVYHIVTRGTLDEKVIKMLAKKEKDNNVLMYAIQERQKELWETKLQEIL